MHGVTYGKGEGTVRIHGLTSGAMRFALRQAQDRLIDALRRVVLRTGLLTPYVHSEACRRAIKFPDQWRNTGCIPCTNSNGAWNAPYTIRERGRPCPHAGETPAVPCVVHLVTPNYFFCYSRMSGWPPTRTSEFGINFARHTSSSGTSGSRVGNLLSYATSTTTASGRAARFC